MSHRQATTPLFAARAASAVALAFALGGAQAQTIPDGSTFDPLAWIQSIQALAASQTSGVGGYNQAVQLDTDTYLAAGASSPSATQIITPTVDSGTGLTSYGTFFFPLSPP
jgi:hypothetical protein